MNVVDSPPGMHEPVEALELLGLAHLDDLRAEPAQHRRVLAHVSLEGENADPCSGFRHRPNASAGPELASRPSRRPLVPATLTGFFGALTKEVRQ